jgi:hypothetical protein
LLQGVGAALGRQHGDEIGELLGLQSQELVAGLGGLQGACHGMILRDERRKPLSRHQLVTKRSAALFL